MADKYDKNGYGGDFKRNPKEDNKDHHDQDGEGSQMHPKAGEYMRELLGEKIKIDQSKFPISTKLLDQEVGKVQTLGRIPPRDHKYVDIYREKPIKVTTKVLVPVKEHPQFNFVGKLLGPKGNSMKRLQEETMCKMAVLGRGSMKDRQKEEELRNSLDPKYAHLSDELHVEITALGPPAEAHARIAFALAEVRKFLIPDANDIIRQNQMREMVDREYPPGGPRPTSRPPPPRASIPPPPPMSARVPMPAKTKVMSILDRARAAMEESYSYEDGYSSHHHVEPPPPVRAPVRSIEPEYYSYEPRSHERYYEEEYQPSYKTEAREYKVTSRDVGSRRAVTSSRYHARASPYTRPPK